MAAVKDIEVAQRAGRGGPATSLDFSRAGEHAYVLTPALVQRRAALRHLMDCQVAAIGVIGDVGSGKTALAHHLALELAQPTLYVNARDDVALACLREELAFLCRRSSRHVADSENRARVAAPSSVVLLDDAHALQPEVLEQLLDTLIALPATTRAMTLVMFAEPTIGEVLQSWQRRCEAPQWWHRVYMPRFTSAELATLLDSLLTQHGYASALADRHKAALVNAAKGSPGRLIAALQDALPSLPLEIAPRLPLASLRDLFLKLFR